MTWEQFTAHLDAMQRRRERHTSGVLTDPDSWAGADQDPFWQKHRSKRAGGR